MIPILDMHNGKNSANALDFYDHWINVRENELQW